MSILGKVAKKVGHYALASTGLPAIKKLATGDILGAAKATLGGQLANDAGIDIAPDIKDPNAGDYLAGTDANAREAMRRAYEMADKNAIREPDSIVADRVNAAHVGGPIATEAHDAGGVERAQVERVGAAPQIVSPWLPDAEKIAAAKTGPIQNAEGATIGPAALQQGTAVGRADTTSVGEEQLKRAALGEAPSKAEALLNAGLDKAAQKQLSLAASAKGSERRGARRSAMIAIGAQGADAAQQAAALRADEMERARTALATTEQGRQRLTQDANNLQAQIDAAAARGDAESVNRLKAQQAEIESRASEVNAGAVNARGERNADREMTAEERNAAAVDARNSERAGYNFKAQDANAARDMAARESDAGRATTASMADAAAANARAESLVRRKDESDQQYADRVQKTSEANAGREMEAQKANATNDLAAAGSNVTNRERADESNARTKLDALSGARDAAAPITQVELAKLGAAQKVADMQHAQRNAINQTLLKAGTALATGGGSLAVPGGAPTIPGAQLQGTVDDVPSDKRLKTDIKRVKPGEAMRLADVYKKLVSTYKLKEGAGHTTAGVMAQDLKRDPLGKKFVHDNDGTLSVDYNGLNSAVIAGLAAKLEARAQRTAKGRRA